jgi:cation transport ATPase
VSLVPPVVVLLPALVALALPLPWWLARWRARHEGIAFRDRAALRAARRIDTVLLDRWGTVTTGELVVSSIDPLEEGNGRNLRWFAAALEHAADHPVGRAIARLSSPGHLTAVELFPGRGISGSVDRHPVRVGAPGWLGMEERHGLGETVAVEVDHRPFGYVTVTDQLRADAAPAVARLRALGAEVVLLSDGDALNAEHLAQSSGIDQWLIAGESEKRERLVREHREGGRSVALVARRDANAEALAAADLAVTDSDDGAPELRMADLDVGRVARALTLANAMPAAALRARLVGVLVTGVGLVLAAVDRLTLVTGIAGALLGCALVVAVAAPWERSVRAEDSE